MVFHSVLYLPKVEVQDDLELPCNESIEVNVGINYPSWHAVKATMSLCKVRTFMLVSLILILTLIILIETPPRALVVVERNIRK